MSAQPSTETGILRLLTEEDILSDLPGLAWGEELQVKRISAPFFFHLGAAIRGVLNLEDSEELGEAHSRLTDLTDILRGLVSHDFGLPVSKRMIDRAIDVCDKSALELFEFSEPEKRALYGLAIRRAKKAAGDMQGVLFEEFATLPIFVVSKKAIYDTDTLLTDAVQAIPEKLRQRLPQAAIEDFRKAGQCLALECATAVGFHMWRAAETVLHHYYLHTCGLPVRSKRLNGWGPYVCKLRKNAKAEQDPRTKEQKELIAALIDGLRARHRNPTMHPQLVLTMEEALAVFDQGRNLIQAMAELLEPTSAGENGGREEEQACDGPSANAGVA